MEIQELYDNELAYWTMANQKFLGVSPIDETEDFAKIQAAIDEDCEKYWNSDTPCKLAQNLNSGLLNADFDKQTPKSYKLKLNFHNMCIDVYGDYNGKNLIIAAIPTPSNDLCWIINRTHYVTRVTAKKEYYGWVRKHDFETVYGEGWSYDISKNTFECIINNEDYKFEPTIDVVFSRLCDRSKLLLEACLGEKLTIDNFTKALRKLTMFDNESIFNYKFSRLEYFEEAVVRAGKYASPTKHIILGVNTIVASKSKNYTAYGEKLEGCLIRSESNIFALENFRTCVNIYENSSSNTSFQPAFTYKDTNGFFDSFKTVTSKAAGRQRLLLDNVVINDGMLWIVDNKGKLHNMYEYMNMPQSDRLSCLSEAPFCNNDKPKRIMMNAKMTSQAVPLADEVDNITHRINARVGFTDIEGYTSADSIVISESFANKLRTFDSTILYLNKNSKLYLALKDIYDDTNLIDIDTLVSIFPTKNFAILLGYENAHISKIDEVDVNNVRVFIEWEIPFRLGDKITNLHGAKGTVGLILPDDQMPRLTKKVGNMEAGPLEVIISGFSTMRRGSLGQIFEAWARASDIKLNDNDYISIMIEKYKKQMEKYSKNSIVEYNGVKNIIPVGINHIMRLYHHASTKISCSSADHGYTRTLRFGEMEKLNLVANDCPNILRELGIRSVTKYIGSHKLITEIEETRTLPKNPKMSMQFIEILKSMGYDLIISEDDSDNVIANSISNNSSEDNYDTDYEDTDNEVIDYVDDYDEIDEANFNNIIKKENLANESND